MRGRGNFDAVDFHFRGITPAYAGKSPLRPCVSSASQDHPRVCGEEALFAPRADRALGSPPRMRGRGDHRAGAQLVLGITPAYAGKRGTSSSRRKRHGDHPRVCGEELCIQPCGPRQGGSPPRMRGRDHHDRGEHPQQGITPAYAGKSPQCPLCRMRPWDHPRVCGEERCSLWSFWECGGSPPRMRGRVGVAVHGVGVLGITPAYAGKSLESRWASTAPRDHPRVCGEEPVEQNIAGVDLGSPPRMRGRVFEAPIKDLEYRITPAYAGKRGL